LNGLSSAFLLVYAISFPSGDQSASSSILSFVRFLGSIRPSWKSSRLSITKMSLSLVGAAGSPSLVGKPVPDAERW
jgi:hypothetical protein